MTFDSSKMIKLWIFKLSHSPQVCCVVVWLLFHQFWTHVQWCSLNTDIRVESNNINFAERVQHLINSKTLSTLKPKYYLNWRQNEGIDTHCPSKPEITQLHHATLAQQDVLRFHVAMKNAMRMQVEERRHQLTGDRLNLIPDDIRAKRM